MANMIRQIPENLMKVRVNRGVITKSPSHMRKIYGKYPKMPISKSFYLFYTKYMCTTDLLPVRTMPPIISCGQVG